VTSEGVKPDPQKVKAVKEFPIPNNTTDVKSFLGLAGYYRKFIPHFSNIAKPLNDLLKKRLALALGTGPDRELPSPANSSYTGTSPAISRLYQTICTYYRRIWVCRRGYIKPR
jgi:hypothetical protein